MESNWNIQSTYLKVYDYIKAINKIEDELQRLRLVKSTLDPENLCFPNNSLLPGQFSGFMFSPAENLDQLLSRLDVLKKAQVEIFIKQSLGHCQSILPGSPGILCILPGRHPESPDASRILRTVGVVADATSEIIRLFISPVKGWQKWVKPVIAHEYNHYIRIQKYKKVETLLDHLVLEGLAEAFSRKISPDVTTYYTEEDYITQEDRERTWNIMFPNLESEKSLDKHMFGEDKAYSFLTDEQKATLGYTIGYQIVRSCINQRYTKRNTEADWIELTQLDSKIILNDSNFTPAH